MKQQDEPEIPGLVSASPLKPIGRIKRRLIQGSVEIQESEADSIVYQHSVLCQTVMPYRNPGASTRLWNRKQGAVCLEIEAGRAFDRRVGTKKLRYVCLGFTSTLTNYIKHSSSPREKGVSR